jgi:hypothetical protein
MELNMSNISITDLTVRQCRLLDTMWQLQSREEFESWLEELTPKERREVHALKQVLLHELMEISLHETSFEESGRVLQKFSL